MSKFRVEYVLDDVDDSNDLDKTRHEDERNLRLEDRKNYRAEKQTKRGRKFVDQGD